MTDYLAPFVHLDSVSGSASSLPVVCNRNPEPNETGVGEGYATLLDLWNPTGISFKPTTIQVTINGLDAVVDGVVQSPFTGSLTESWFGAWIRIDLSGVSWRSLSTITVEVEAETWDGSTLDETYSYTIEDTTAPEIYSVRATGRKTVEIEYAQAVADENASSVVADLPWGSESLEWDSDRGCWVFSPLSYPYLASTISEPYNVVEGTALELWINGTKHTLAIPTITGTSASQVASSLQATLNAIGAEALALGGVLYIANQDPTGAIEVGSRGAQEALKLETGVKHRRVAYGTPEGTYSTLVTANYSGGVVEYQTVDLELSSETTVLEVVDRGVVMGDSAEEASNYVMSFVQETVLSEMRPTWTPTVESVERVGGNTFTLVLDTDMTPLGPYTVTVSGVADVSGNVLDADHNSGLFRGYTPQTPELRNFDLYKMQSLTDQQNDDSTGHTMLKFIRVLQETVDQILTDQDEYTDIFNLENSPEWFIEAFLQSHGSPFGFMPISITKKRQLATILVDLLRIRCTDPGIIAALKFFFGFTSVTITKAWGTGWLLGVSGRSEVGSTTVLNSSVRRDKFSIIVEVDRVLTDDELWQVRRVIEVMKPLHIHIKEIKQPEDPFVPDHWQLGYSLLGTETLLH